MTHFLENYWGLLLLVAVSAIVVGAVISHRRRRAWVEAWESTDADGKQAIFDALPPTDGWADFGWKMDLQHNIDHARRDERAAADCLRLKVTPEGLKHARLVEKAENRGITVQLKDDVDDLAYKLEALDAHEKEAHHRSLKADLPAV